MVLGIHLRGNKQQDNEDAQTLPIFANTAVATRHQVPAQEAENRRDKGIDIDMIDPEEITQELQMLAHFNYTVQTRKLIDADAGGRAQIVTVDEARVGIRPWAIAALGYLNKVWPTIWMTPYEADTMKLRIRTAFRDLRKSMNYDDKRRYSIILRMVRDLCLARCEDMKDGHKALLLKVKREELGVHMTRGEAQKGMGK